VDEESTSPQPAESLAVIQEVLTKENKGKFAWLPGGWFWGDMTVKVLLSAYLTGLLMFGPTCVWWLNLVQYGAYRRQMEVIDQKNEPGYAAKILKERSDQNWEEVHQQCSSTFRSLPTSVTEFKNLFAGFCGARTKVSDQPLLPKVAKGM